MASSFTNVYQYGRPENLDATPLIKAATYKQQNYDANTTQIQQLINKYASTDLLRDIDKDYLGNRLNTLVSYINQLGTVDWSRKDVTEGIANYVGNAIDTNVLSAVASTQAYQKHVAAMDELKKDPKKAELYSAANDAYATRDLQRYMTSGKLGDRYRQDSYTPYTDVNKLILDNEKLLKNYGVQTFFTSDGKPYFATISKHEILNETTSKKFLDMILGDKGKTQLYIDGWNQFRGLDDNAVNKMYDDNIRSQISQYDSLAKSMGVALAGAPQKQKAAIQAQMDSYKNASSALGSKLNSTNNVSRDAKTGDLYTSSYIDGWAKVLSYDNITEQKIDDSGFRFDNEKWERGYKKAKMEQDAFFDSEKLKIDAANLQIEGKKLDIEMQKALTKGEISIDSNGNVTQGNGVGVAGSNGITMLPSATPLEKEEGVLAEDIVNKYQSDWNDASQAGAEYFKALSQTDQGKKIIQTVFGSEAAANPQRLTWLLTQGNDLSQARYANLKNVLQAQAQGGVNAGVALKFMTAIEKAQGSYADRTAVLNQADGLKTKLDSLIKSIDGRKLTEFRGFQNGVIKADGSFDPNGSYLNSNRKFENMTSDEKAGYYVNIINSLESDNNGQITTPQQMSLLKTLRSNLINNMRDPKARDHFRGLNTEKSDGFFSSIGDAASEMFQAVKGSYYGLKAATFGDDSDRKKADQANKEQARYQRRVDNYNKGYTDWQNDIFNSKYDFEDLDSDQFGRNYMGVDKDGYGKNGQTLLKELGMTLSTLDSEIQSKYKGSYGKNTINVDTASNIGKAMMPDLKAYFNGMNIVKDSNITIDMDPKTNMATVTALIKKGKNEELFPVSVRMQDLPQALTHNINMTEKNFAYDPINNPNPRSFYMEGEVFKNKNEILTSPEGILGQDSKSKTEDDVIKNLEVVYGKDEIAKHRDEIAQIMQQTVGIKGYAPGNGTYVADISIGGQVIERQILKGDIENIKNQINVDKNQIAYENIINYIKNTILSK